MPGTVDLAHSTHTEHVHDLVLTEENRAGREPAFRIARRRMGRGGCGGGLRSRNRFGSRVGDSKWQRHRFVGIFQGARTGERRYADLVRVRRHNGGVENPGRLRGRDQRVAGAFRARGFSTGFRALCDRGDAPHHQLSSVVIFRRLCFHEHDLRIGALSGGRGFFLTRNQAALEFGGILHGRGSSLGRCGEHSVALALRRICFGISPVVCRHRSTHLRDRGCAPMNASHLLLAMSDPISLYGRPITRMK
ncbi:MAG: hypothetical protein GY910_18325 [bacterium]|nr:hypothetical protein [bacterium]